MSCNKNYECRKIAKNYQTISSDIANKFSKVQGQISDIDDKLSKQIIPNDYLGEKISDKLKKIKENCDSNLGVIERIKGSMISFVDNKAKEHQKHYENWLSVQEKKKSDNEDEEQ